MALSDDVRAGEGRDVPLNDQIVAALRPDITGQKPDVLHSWDALFAFMRTIPGVRYRMGANRLGPSPAGEALVFQAAITANDGANRFPPVATPVGRADPDDVERRTLLEAILRAKGL